MAEPESRSNASALRTAGELSAVGLSFVFALGIGFGAGHLFDRWFGTAPWLTLVGVVLGLVAGILNVYRAVARAMRRR